MSLCVRRFCFHKKIRWFWDTRIVTLCFYVVKRQKLRCPSDSSEWPSCANVKTERALKCIRSLDRLLKCINWISCCLTGAWLSNPTKYIVYKLQYGSTMLQVSEMLPSRYTSIKLLWVWNGGNDLRDVLAKTKTLLVVSELSRYIAQKFTNLPFCWFCWLNN